MKHGIRRILSLLLALVLVVGILPPMSADAAAPVDYYGRNALAKMANADALLFAYDQLLAGIMDCESTVSVYDGVNPITGNEIRLVMDWLEDDHTGLFWYSGYSYTSNSESVYAVKPRYTLSGSALEAARAAFDDVANHILAGISQSMSEYEKELYIHDALAARVTYTSTSNAHNAYGALVEGKAVCDGYSKSFQYLLQQAGIQSLIVTGYSKNPSNGTSVGHAWNIVRIDGKYYHVDVTWDDQGETLYHAYFNLTDERIQEDHIIESTGIPACNSEDAFYFHNKPTYLDTYTTASVGKLLKDNGNRVHVYVPGDVDAFGDWYFDNAWPIANAAGIYSGFSCGYSKLGRELILHITPKGCAHTNLTQKGGVEPTCTTEGQTTYYTCACGKWFEDAGATTEITDHNSVIINRLGHQWDDGTVTKEPTENETGVRTYTCARCGDTKTESIPKLAHTHNYTIVVTDPTCTTGGYTTHTCACGDNFTTAPINPLGHDWDWDNSVVTKEPTEEEPGIRTYTCTRCGATDTAEIPKLEHTHKYTSNVTNPTCTAGGYTTHTCACGYQYVDSYTDPTDHSMGAWTVLTAATCTAKGSERRDCANCDHYEARDTDMIPHSYTDVVTNPTCTEKGFTTHTCTCGDSYKDSYVNPLDHAWNDGVITKQPTEDAEGVRTYTCSRCGKTKTESIPKLDHVHKYKDVVTKPTCFHQGFTTHICKCGDQYTDSYTGPLEHDWDDGVVTKEPTETEEGTLKRTCSLCDLTSNEPIPKLDHVHKYTHHTFAPTCTEKGYILHSCTCGDFYQDSYTDPLNHIWGEDLVTKAPTEKEPGILTNICTRCHKTKETEIPKLDHVHKYTDVVTDPTCTEKGFTTHTCACGDSYKDSYVNALDHAWNDGVITKQPTEDTEGVRTYTCSRCDKTKTESIPKLNHVHKYTDVVTDPTCTEKGFTTRTCVCGDSFVDSDVAALGHDWNNPAASYKTCRRCGHTEGTPPTGDGYRITLDMAEVGETKSVWIDGVEYPVNVDGDRYHVDLETTGATNLVVYTFNDPNAADVHTQYPIGMKVWILTFDGTAYTAKYVPEFDNLLEYEGSAIRITGVKGIRMITSIAKPTKQALTGKGVAGYTLVEYGTALAWAADIRNGLVLGQEYTKSNYAYKKGVADPVFKDTGKMIQYTNVLVGFNDDQCIPDIAMRPYIILADAEGNQVTIYGGVIYRSIGYIAYQNRNAFKAGSNSYNYIWGIIHHVYGDKYDADFKG